MKFNILLIVLIQILYLSCKKNAAISVTKSKIIQEDLHLDEYRIGLFKNKIVEFNFQKPTHIIIIGSALKEDSDQFFQSGISRAQRYKEIWPDEQIILISSPDVLGATDNQIFEKYKIPVLRKIDQKLTAELLLNEIGKFENIAGLDFYGHSSPWAMIIDKSGAAFDPSAHFETLKQLRHKFLPNAFVTLNGCNTGFYLAPDLSRALALPVSGSLTSSLFEQIESDGFWYKENDFHQAGYILFNPFSYKATHSCSLGICTRMKSSRENYSSYWGTFNEGGLSFDKFFCNYENNKDGSCESGMAMSLLSFPSVHPIDLASSQDDFKKIVYDWLCSTGRTKSYFQNCVNGIEKALSKGDLKYQSHPTNELICDFNSCNAKVVCKYKPFKGGPLPGSCKIETTLNPAPTNIVTEYLSLIKGFETIRIP